MSELIAARILKGFRDFLPADEAKRRVLSARIEKVFCSYGFVPIDTPALEFSEVLLGKGSGETEKQIYRWHDNGGRDVALRFDLTVPFARYIAGHRSELPMPFKRYHIAKVWRGENTQRGRYREFTQCDIDIIGMANAASDAEILIMMREALFAIGAAPLTIHVNHRGLFNRFLTRMGIEDKLIAILRTVDKLSKINRTEIEAQLTELCGWQNTAQIMDFIELKGDWDHVLLGMANLAGGEDQDTKRLREIALFLNDSGIENGIILNPSITRGLDYYTGLVFETFMDEAPEIGSICSGGRYDNLCALYTNEALTGVGGSIGLDRLIAALESLNRAENKSPYAFCAIACVNEAHFGICQRLAKQIREAGFSCEIYSEAKKLSSQFIQAEKKGTCFMLIPDIDSPYTNDLTLRNLSTRQDKRCSVEEAIKIFSAYPLAGLKGV
ncbi:MAG: histidine--tRNA ligase [Termitinemataceae bacterium]|nr:MAG: histidine--tRNA ligase [Termitinemataceae bacterium]